MVLHQVADAGAGAGRCILRDRTTAAAGAGRCMFHLPACPAARAWAMRFSAARGWVQATPSARYATGARASSRVCDSVALKGVTPFAALTKALTQHAIADCQPKPRGARLCL